MKTRKLLFTLVATMTMVFGLTLTAHAEEAAPATKVVGVEGIGTFTVPADWTEEYIEGYGTYWFNPTKTACVAMSTTGSFAEQLAPIDVYAAIEKTNLEEFGCNALQWNVTKFFGHDSIDYIMAETGNTQSPVNYPVMTTANFSCGHEYYSGNSIMDAGCMAVTIEELQTILPVLATYKPVQ